MVELRQLAERLDQPALARLGAALWAKVGGCLTRKDLAWGNRLLGIGGSDLLWIVLVERGVIDRHGRVSGKALARILGELSGGDGEDFDSAQVVWTLPNQHPDTTVAGTGYRDAIASVIDHTEFELLLSSPYIEETGVRWLTDALLRAIQRGVEITIITHRAKDLASLQSKALENLRRAAETQGKRLKVYSIDGQSGFIVHAKIVVSDAQTFVIGSANITGKGLGGHLECGVIGTGPQANLVKSVIRKAIESGIVSIVFSTA